MSKNQKIRVGVLFGGRSAEHEVSIVSAQSVAKALNPDRYEVTLIGIDKAGRWILADKAKQLMSGTNVQQVEVVKEGARDVTLLPYHEKQNLILASTDQTSPVQSQAQPPLPKLDVIFPVLHGSYGEDGTIQGLFELASIPYVGSGVIGSAIGMDKEIAKVVYASAEIPVVPARTVRKHEFAKKSGEIIDSIIRDFGLPFFIKPANMGSSVGVHKISKKEDALTKFNNAFLYDTKVLAEKAIDARELEVSVLGNHEPRASVIGELVATHDFYSYEAKYVDAEGAKYFIPAQDLTDQQMKTIQDYALRAFKAIECRGMARVDFFLDRKTGAIYLNEINTIPGFTPISMYPKMWAASGLQYSDLLDELIRLAFEQHREKSELKTTYQA